MHLASLCLVRHIETTTGSQWAAQVSESIELRLTYGLVISALLFLGVASVLKYLVRGKNQALFYSVTRSDTAAETISKEIFGLNKLFISIVTVSTKFVNL